MTEPEHHENIRRYLQGIGITPHIVQPNQVSFFWTFPHLIKLSRALRELDPSTERPAIDRLMRALQTDGKDTEPTDWSHSKKRPFPGEAHLRRLLVDHEVVPAGRFSLEFEKNLDHARKRTRKQESEPLGTVHINIK